MVEVRRVYPPIDEIALRACFFRKNKKWHRILKHYIVPNVHLAYCGMLESYRPEKITYAGEWNSGEFRDTWIECDICEWLHADDR